jgi:hypothetical protein
VSQLDALDLRWSGDTAERLELRDVVQHQLSIIRRMQGRREVIMRERAQLVDLLRALWSLVRAATDTRDDEARIVERFYALCVEIQTKLGRPAKEFLPAAGVSRISS